MTRARQTALCDKSAAEQFAPWQSSRGLDLASDAWRVIDRLAQLSPQELHEQRGTIMALELKLSALREGRP
jgi:hypothetical protein